MQPSNDPLIRQEQGDPRGGYQSIEPGGTGVPVESEKTFFAQVKEAKEQSQGCCDFCVIFFSLLIGSIVWTIVMAITLTLPIAMIVIGVTYFHDCKDEMMIPIFNVVAGCVLTVNNVMNLVVRYNRFSDPAMPRRPTAVGWLTTIFNIFLMGWFFAGCYWTYHIHPTKDNECQLTLYYFTYWLLNATFLFFGTVVVACSITLCLVAICW